MPEVKFQMNPKLFLREPQDTQFGQRILFYGVDLFYKIGFESFTFKKLAEEMGSVEASVYRYFENKHKLLLYLTNWYWKWVRYSIEMHTLNIDDPERKLKIMIAQIINASIENHSTQYINENLLQQVVVREGVKSYHVQNIDQENEEGLFLPYKELVELIANLFLEINPDFPYSVSMASNLLEMANNQLYFAEHLPRLTDIGESNAKEELEEMLSFFIERLIR